VTKTLNLKNVSLDADKYIRDCKLHREHVKVSVLAEKCGFEVKTDDYVDVVKGCNETIYGAEQSLIDANGRGLVACLDDTKLIAVSENQSFEYKRFVAAYLLFSYLMNSQDAQLYLEIYDNNQQKHDILQYVIDILVPDELLKPKLSNCDFDDLMMYFKVPDFVLREKVLRKKVSNNEVI